MMRPELRVPPHLTMSSTQTNKLVCSRSRIEKMEKEKGGKGLGV